MEENYYSRLKELLKDRNLTVKSMLNSVNMTSSQFDSLLRYDNVPRADMAVKIANLLDTTVEYMIDGKRNDNYPPDIMVAVRQLLTLDKARRAPILANIGSQVDFWKSASPDIVPEVEGSVSEEDEFLIEEYHKLSDRDKKVIMSMISALKNEDVPFVD